MTFSKFCHLFPYPNNGIRSRALQYSSPKTFICLMDSKSGLCITFFFPFATHDVVSRFVRLGALGMIDNGFHNEGRSLDEWVFMTTLQCGQRIAKLCSPSWRNGDADDSASLLFRFL